MELEQAVAGTLAQILDVLQDVEKEIARARTRGGTGDPERIFWDPAASNVTAEYSYDGTFASVGIFNLSAGVIRVSLTPNGARVDNSSLLTLAARGFIVLPYRGTTVSVGGAAAGSALIVPCEQPQDLVAGIF